MFVDANGNDIEDDNLRKLADKLTEITNSFTDKCKKTAEEHDVNLTVVVKFVPKNLKGE